MLFDAEGDEAQLLTVHLPDELFSRITAHLQASYPNEGGGFLLGSPADAAVYISDIIPIPNTFSADEQWHRYAMTPQDWARLEDQADERGLTLVGYFHSHPDSPAIPSDYDREHALPNFTYLITAVYAGTAGEMRVWRLHPDRSIFDELMLVRTAGTLK